MKFELKTLDEYSDAAILAELRHVAESLNGQRLTVSVFHSLSRVNATTVRRRFGTWGAALDKAGISEEIAPRLRFISRDEVIQALRDFAAENPGVSVSKECIAQRLDVDRGTLTKRFGKWEKLLDEVGIAPFPRSRRYTDEDCFENILTLWTHYGRQPHVDELKRSPSTVGPTAYTRRWGGWRAALAAFVKKVNETETSPVDISSVEPSRDIQKDVKLEPISPRSIPLGLRYKILLRDRFRCVTCGASPAKDVGVELQVDHIHPWSRGGQNVEENLRTLCANCNLGKGARLEDGRYCVPGDLIPRDVPLK